MRIWIDVEDASGNKLGDGPITTALGWTSVRRLDQAGNFAFAMPATDPRAALIQHRRIVRCYGLVDEVITEFGAGVVNRTRITVADNAPILTVEGDDLLSQLLDRSVGFLELSAATTKSPDECNHVTALVTTDMTNARDGNPATYDNIAILSNHYLYIGHELPFASATFDLGTVQTNGATLSAQYFQDGFGWQTLSITDGTASGGKPFAQDGTISWTTPTDWAPANHYEQVKYWIRFQPSANLSAVQFNEITIPALGPTSSDLSPIIAKAPSGWTLDTGSWYGSTADGTYLQFAGESVLAALSKVAAHHGEHFRLGSGKEIEWLRQDTPTSGIRAEQMHGGNPIGVEGNPNVALILLLEEEQDGFSLITRVYPYGAGNGDARVTLADTSRSAPTGYTLSTADNYIKANTPESTYGQIEQYISFKDIAQIELDENGRKLASNQLFDAALAHLKNYQQIQTVYNLAVTNCPEIILPGETVDVVYRRMMDDVLAVDIDATLVVLESTVTISNNGVATSGLVVSDVANWPKSDAAIIASAVDNGTVYEAHPQPVQGELVDSAPAVWNQSRNPGWSTSSYSSTKSVTGGSALGTVAAALCTLIDALKEQGILGT